MFSTSSVKSFRLGPFMNQDGNERSQSRHVIWNADGVAAGAVTLDGPSRSYEDEHGQEREFIVLAETHCLYKDVRLGEFENRLVMLVERLDNGIYERRGLGHVLKTHWAAAEPETKTVITWLN
jgi:hypothetical protein